ncbi:50S ribosomal protein L3 [Sediminispirochaeta bajacaliforniensis]|uniref:50S ribosomal protein L3 n=1 Tax=Sediminispirochaeta bajacaliforniensis TaxID=148 RepID=UPI0003817B42|nr:50S ribosomal protein L3 [Sediminispirochaeta bajacaliforniensis]
MLGLIGKKVGMTQIFDERGVLTPVTVIKIEDNVVIDKRDEEKNGYTASVIGAEDLKSKHVTKPYGGQFPENVHPKRYLVEMRDFEAESSVGETLGVGIFKEISFVDVVGTSKGKGYQGAMKRHGFKGGRATHGSKFHRGLGGTGMAATPSKVLKGAKMPGRMGAARTTVQNLRVIKVDEEKQVLMVKGAIPGPRQSMVIVQKAKKK